MGANKGGEILSRTSQLAAGLLIIGATSTGALAGAVQTIRYDLIGAPLGFFGNEIVQDFFYPAVDSEIVTTRFHLEFVTSTTTGDFNAANIGLALQPPVPDPEGGPQVLTGFFTGADFGWSGSGTFSIDFETDALNGGVIDFPPDTVALLYGVSYYNALSQQDPPVFEPLGGQFIASYIEVDYVEVPSPGAAALLPLGLLAVRRRR